MTQPDLFEMPHDAGGKVRSRLLPGVSGSAIFGGERDCYRTELRRWTGDDFPQLYAMWIGMNPSVAAAHVNDPTIGREWSFTLGWGLRGMIKGNVSDYCATHPSDLDQVDQPISARNVGMILANAKRARLVIMAHGVLPRVLGDAGAQLTRLLREAGVELWCLGRTANGSPRHPLYIKSGTLLQPY